MAYRVGQGLLRDAVDDQLQIRRKGRQLLGSDGRVHPGRGFAHRVSQGVDRTEQPEVVQEGRAQLPCERTHLVQRGTLLLLDGTRPRT